MSIGALGLLLLVFALTPFLYYGLALFSSWKFFRPARKSACRASVSEPEFTPAVSILKRVRGSDSDVYDNFASLCVQDYPDYEIVCCIDGPDDPVYSLITEVRGDFPDRRFRFLFGSCSSAPNDNVDKLAL